jgi:hypothetical protein
MAGRRGLRRGAHLHQRLLLPAAAPGAVQRGEGAKLQLRLGLVEELGQQRLQLQQLLQAHVGGGAQRGLALELLRVAAARAQPGALLPGAFLGPPDEAAGRGGVASGLCERGCNVGRLAQACGGRGARCGAR